MAWPLSQDYNEAIQSPRTSFADPELQAGSVAVGPMGLPMPRSGNFADVYQFHGPNGLSWAVKCFTRQVDALQDRYAAIGAHLNRAKLPFTVGFEFLPQGIRVRGKWYPILKMEWVEGLTLNAFVKSSLGKPEQLKALLGIWSRLCPLLRDAKVAHADLQHGNVLLVPGATANKLKLRLIDYDGMWVPALAERPSGEAGHPAYQHPERLRQQIYSPDVDRFPHLAIGCALRALAVAGPKLWGAYDNGDNLLFREADFANPARSKLFHELWDLNDPTVTNLVALLIQSAQRPLAQTPWLDEVLQGDKAAVGANVLRGAAETLGVARRAVQKTAAADQIFVATEEVNPFADLWAAAADSPASRRRKQKRSAAPLALVGGGVAVAVAAVVIGLVAFGGNSKPTPVDDKHLPDANPPVVALPKPPAVAWPRVDPGPAVAVARQVSAEVDTPSGVMGIVRGYGHPPVKSLGAWLPTAGNYALLASPVEISRVNLATGNVGSVVKAETPFVRVAISPDMKVAVTADEADGLHCYRLQDGNLVWRAKFPGPVGAAAVTPDGLRVAAAGPTAGYVEWDLADGKELRANPQFKATDFRFTPGGTQAIATNAEGVFRWSLDDGASELIAPRFSASTVAVSPDGARAWAAGAALKVKSWKLPEWEPLREVTRPIASPVEALEPLADGQVLLGGRAGEVAVLHPSGRSHRLEEEFQAGASVAAISAAANGRHALVGLDRGQAMFIRIGDGKRQPVVKKATPKSMGCLEKVREVATGKKASGMSVNADGTLVAVAAQTNIDIYEAETGRKAGSLPPMAAPVYNLGLVGADQLLVNETGDTQRLVVWNWRNGKAGKAVTLPPGFAGSQLIRPVPGRNWAIARSQSLGDIAIDLESAAPLASLPPPSIHAKSVIAAAPNGQSFAIATASGPVQLWNANTAKFDFSFDRSEGAVDLAFAPDGRQLIGLWRFGRIRVWDAATGKLEREVSHELQGNFLSLTALGNGLVLTWPIPVAILNLESGRPADVGSLALERLASQAAVADRLFALDVAGTLTIWKLDPVAAVKNATFIPPPDNGLFADARITRDGPGNVVGAAVVDQGRVLAVASASGKVQLFSVDRLELRAETTLDKEGYRGLTHGTQRLYALGRKSVTSWDTRTFEKISDVPITPIPANAPVVFAVDPEDNAVLIATDRMRRVDMAKKKETPTVPPPRAPTGRPITQYAHSENGRGRVARWGNAYTLFWRLGDNEVKVLENARAPAPASPRGLAVTPDGRHAVLGYQDGRVSIWDTRMAKDPSPFALPVPKSASRPAVVAVAAPTNTKAVIVRADGKMTVVDLRDNSIVREIDVAGIDGYLAIAPGGKSFAWVADGVMQVFNLP